MASFIPLGGFQLPFQRRLSRLYNDTKKSSDFVKEPISEDPEIKAMHRKLKIQKDRLVSWGLEWSEPSNQSPEIDEALSKAGLSDLVGSIMSTIKDILAEAEPLWLSSKRRLGAEKEPEKGTGDRKTPIVVWDKARFQDLIKDLTASIDTLHDLSRTRSFAASSNRAAMLSKSQSSLEELRPFESTRMQTPQQINPQTLTNLKYMQPIPMSEPTSSQIRPQEVVFMSKQAYSDLTDRPGRQPWSPLLLEHAQFDAIYSTTGIMPSMSRFEKLSSGLQTESHRSPGAWIGLPLLLGYYEDMDNSRLGLVYQFPPTFNPVIFENLTQNPIDSLCTLSELLSRPDFEPRLEVKFRLAHNLANTVFDMHARGITHGNLLDSTISFCNPVGNEAGLQVREVDIRKPLISSFDVFPGDTPASSSPVTTLYRHPLDPRTTKQSPLASNSDTKTLDLYSLAMLLVSIGLWTKLENLVPNHESPSIPESVLEQLAIRCGSLYMKAVQACWNAVDQELARPGATNEILNQVQLRSSRYLEACSILDGVSELDDRFSEDIGDVAAKEHEHQQSLSVSVPALAGPSSPSTHRQSTSATTTPIGFERKPSPVSTDMTQVEAEALTTTRGTKPTAVPTKPPTSKTRLYPHIPLPPDEIQQWNDIIMPQINMALRSFYRKNTRESVEISLESIGESPNKTKPTVLVVCTSVNKVRSILKKKLGVFFDGTTGFGLKVCRGSVFRSRKGSSTVTRYAGEGESGSESEQDAEASIPFYQKRPHSGASIGAWIGDKHLPAVSFGGLIIVDDKPYGMTVHHMLDDPESGQAHSAQMPLKSSAAAQDMPAYHEDSSAESSSSSEDFTCEFSDSESDDTDTDDDESDDEEFTETGDIPGVEPGCGEGYIITQPALDDVEEGFYPSEHTMNEEHIDSFRLGEVYASSGIRRLHAPTGLVHEIDWALFEFEDKRLPDKNNMPRVEIHNQSLGCQVEPLRPTMVAPSSELPGLEVQCVARSSGLQRGLIMPALVSVKMLGRSSPSHSYQVSSRATSKNSSPQSAQLDTMASDHRGHSDVALGFPGDSGAWLIECRNGQLCGHVLAWSSLKRVAYICPMEVLFCDIAETLEATEVRLPGGKPVAGIQKAGIAEISDDDLQYLEEEDDYDMVSQLSKGGPRIKDDE
ncbi:uncharacterized protein BCR38DRAFT_399436 [Pseudomassariella vexata]|uniref:Uncharacterized protein n=1 Tax=Pseudomassariella vexata TaxID=1141098 RepID=A0A1Y2DJ00_9PEZI|nr:uncharacterized protein BCR38DRAFT_399436 [Pseudomassariella vexata]ORY59190.1 hypothetical protein BCR38DRAFT_399436 [Pseudomassariella vexata]